MSGPRALTGYDTSPAPPRSSTKGHVTPLAGRRLATAPMPGCQLAAKGVSSTESQSASISTELNSRSTSIASNALPPRAESKAMMAPTTALNAARFRRSWGVMGVEALGYASRQLPAAGNPRLDRYTSAEQDSLAFSHEYLPTRVLIRYRLRRGPQRSEDTRRLPAEPALDGVRKVLTRRVAAAAGWATVVA